MTSATQTVSTRLDGGRNGHEVRPDRTTAIGLQWQRLVDAWKAVQEARAGRWVDRWLTHRRNAHERYLERAQDHYELERLERAWERNPEWWR